MVNIRTTPYTRSLGTVLASDYGDFYVYSARATMHAINVFISIFRKACTPARMRPVRTNVWPI